MKVVYIAGPFRGATTWEIEQNIRRAEALALEVWQLGGLAVICPHTNTRFFHGAASDEIWLEGDLELVRRSDLMLTTVDWARSSGAVAEVELTQRLGIPVFHTIQAVTTWLARYAA